MTGRRLLALNLRLTFLYVVIVVAALAHAHDVAKMAILLAVCLYVEELANCVARRSPVRGVASIARRRRRDRSQEAPSSPATAALGLFEDRTWIADLL